MGRRGDFFIALHRPPRCRKAFTQEVTCYLPKHQTSKTWGFRTQYGLLSWVCFCCCWLIWNCLYKSDTWFYLKNQKTQQHWTQIPTLSSGTFPGGSEGKNLSVQKMWVQFLGQEHPLEKEMVTHSSILAWRIPWTEEPGGLQSAGVQKSRTRLSSLRMATCNEGEWLSLLIIQATFIHVHYLPGSVGFLSLDFLIYKQGL